MSATLSLIAINVAVSVAAFNSQKVMEIGMFMPYRAVRQKTWYELITSGFLHGGITHLAFNMITLFFFGPILEQAIGEVHFLILYFTGLLASSVPSLIKHKDNPQYATIGASGAVEAVLFAFIVIFPFEKIYLFFIPIGIPAIIFGALFVAYSIWASKKEGKINHEAHIGGAVWGLIYMFAFVPNTIDHFLTVFGFYG
ncbi:MAG: rhomboid family intramembrane serine protease [Balneolaceae bacterium]|nr:rhomboid family intramembrane serine protease [Balneolaceae bacterium]